MQGDTRQGEGGLDWTGGVSLTVCFDGASCSFMQGG